MSTLIQYLPAVGELMAIGLPIWSQWLVGIAAAVTAAGVIWRKVLHPMIRLVSLTEKMLPLMVALTETFKDAPNAFAVLYSMYAQFRSDSGSTLKDQINRLEEASLKAGLIAENFRISTEANKVVKEHDRAEIRKLLVEITRLSVKVEEGAASSARMEQHGHDVATDLRESHRRADAVDSEHPGAAADAAAQQTKKEKLEG